MKSLFFSTSNGIFLFLLSSFFSPFNRQTFLSIFNLSFNPSLQNYTFPPHNLSLSMCTSTEFHSLMSTVLLFNKLTHTRKSHSIIVITIVFTPFSCAIVLFLIPLSLLCTFVLLLLPWFLPLQ